jgi:hypothetical protein
MNPSLSLSTPLLLLIMLRWHSPVESWINFAMILITCHEEAW